MTLILSANFSGCSIMTSDTRLVTIEYDFNEEGDYVPVKGGKVVPQDARDTKTYKLSDYVLTGAGGFSDATVHIMDILRSETKPEHDLADCKRILNEIIARERADENKPDYLQFLDIKGTATIILNGFYRDGSTGMVSFRSGDSTVAKEVEHTYKNLVQYHQIAPFKEFSEAEKDILSQPYVYPDTSDVKDDELIAAIFEHTKNGLTLAHGVMSYNHPAEISADFEMHVLSRIGNVSAYRKQQYDHTEAHKQLREGVDDYETTKRTTNRSYRLSSTE